MTTDNNYYNDSDLTDDEIKSEFIANSEGLFDTNYYETLERDNTYYITIPYKINDNYLKDLHISSRGFFENSPQTVKNYIRDYTISSAIPDNSSLEIVKTSYIQLEGGFTLYNIIIKTFWLKIVQRRWRNVMKKRMQMIYHVLKNREYGIRVDLPKLRGCLVDIKNKETVS